ncbi:MAG TPA: hypothetical protein ENH10_06225, partial [Bacteroidetes bacterium]|nr:hypothetical protein [Bacteroidota bacterium]HEX04739.1 hypothetical protein [Bacteroidota bacterium]
DAKLLINLRNPVEAAYSFYYHYIAFHPSEVDNFGDAIKIVPEALDYYHYINHIERFAKYFPREQMNIVLMDDIKADNQKVYRDLCEFIGVEAVPLEAVTKRANTAKQIRSTHMRLAFYNLQLFLGKHAATRRMRDLIASNKAIKDMWGRIKQLNIRHEKYEEMSQESREQLVELFREPNERLGEFLDRDLSHWMKIPEHKGVKAS